MSTFPRIDPQHPLTEAARIVNAMSEERGLEATLEWLDLGTGTGEVAYLAEQRALRAIAAQAVGLNMGLNPGLDEATAQAIVRTPLWRDMRMLLVACYMDGMAIGWKAREIADATPNQATL